MTAQQNIFRKVTLRLSSLLLLCMLSGPADAQLKQFLILEKPGTKKRMRYYVGDEIIFKLNGKKDVYEAVIVGFSDSAFYVGNWTPVAIGDVEAIINRDKVPGVHGLAKSALYAIPVFFVFSAGNNLFNTGRTPIIDPEVYTLSGIFAGIGLAGYMYKGRRYRLKNRWRLVVVNH